MYDFYILVKTDHVETFWTTCTLSQVLEMVYRYQRVGVTMIATIDTGDELLTEVVTMHDGGKVIVNRDALNL